MAETLAEQGFPHTVADQWQNYMYPPAHQAQQFGDDNFAPFTRVQRNDGTWVQKGTDGQYHPYTEFQGFYDPEKGHYDENGNWKFNDDTMYNADGSAKENSATEGYGKLSTTPSDASDPNKQFMTVHSGPTVQPKEQTKSHDWHAWMYPLPQDSYWGREPTANYKEDIANNYDKSSANQQMLAQRAWQKANEDPYNKANRIAQSEANQKFTESQNQLNGSDNTSLVGRQLVEKDPTDYERWGQEQAYKAGEYQNAAINDANSAVNWRKTGAEDQYRYRQKGIYNATSDWLTLGPPEEKEKVQQTQEEVPPQQQEEQPDPWTDKVAMQDVLNCIVQKHWDDGIGKALNNDENQHVSDWKEVARRPEQGGVGNHTFVSHPEYDTPEYHAAVEKAADMLWNGQVVKLEGKEYGGNGLSGVDAAMSVWEGRHGAKGYDYAKGKDWDNKNSPQKTSQTNTSGGNSAVASTQQAQPQQQQQQQLASAGTSVPANIEGTGSDATFHPIEQFITQGLGATYL